MTQHLYVGGSRVVGRGGLRYLTACGRYLAASVQALGPVTVTCRACKNTDAWREASLNAPEPQTWAWGAPEPDPTPGWEFQTTWELGPGVPEYTRVYVRPVIKHTEPIVADPLTTLRAAVEGIRDEALVKSRSMDGAETHIGDDYRAQERAYARAYTRVLDLIDKHTREGQ